MGGTLIRETWLALDWRSLAATVANLASNTNKRKQKLIQAASRGWPAVLADGEDARYREEVCLDSTPVDGLARPR
jgi:hypothetical protein